MPTGRCRPARNWSVSHARSGSSVDSRHLPEARDAVRVESLVDSHDSETAFKSLGREQSVKRIAMVERKRGDAGQVGYFDR